MIEEEQTTQASETADNQSLLAVKAAKGWQLRCKPIQEPECS